MTELIFTKLAQNILSGNSIEFEVAISPYNYSIQKDTIFLVINLSQELSKGSGLYSEIKSQKLSPNSQGMVSLDISSIIDAYLTFFIPPANLDRMIEVPTMQSKQFKAKFSLFDGTEMLAETTKYFYSIKAGAAYQFFNSDLTYKNKGALTEPLLLFITDGEEQCSPDDLFYIYFTTVPGDNTTVRLGYSIIYLHNEEEFTIQGELGTAINTAAANISIACTPAGFKQLGLYSQIPPSATPISYEVSILGDLNNSNYIPSVSFSLDHRNYYNSSQILYRNSLGGLQSLRILGQIDTESDYTYQTTSQVSPPSYILDGNLIAEQEQLYTEERIKFKGETGFLTKYQAERLRDFFLSKEKFVVKNNRFVPIVVNSKNVKFFSNTDNLISVQMEWQEAFASNFFSNTQDPDMSCPAINSLQWRQSATNDITIFFALPFGYNYLRISLEFPGEPLQYYTLEGNSGVQKIAFNRPASAEGITVDLIVAGTVICDRYNSTPSYGPQFIIEPLPLTAEQLPIAVNDNYNIPGGYNTAVVLSGSALANDYDPSGTAIEIIPASGTTSGGGIYSIDLAGIITYQPINSAYSGADTFTYQLRRSPSGAPVTGIVTITVGNVAPNKYVKVVTRNIVSGFYITSAEIWLYFYSDAAGSISADLTPFNMSINFDRDINYFTDGQDTIANNPGTVIATGYGVMVFSGIISHNYHDNQDSVVTTVIVTPGTGYNAI